ncbi:hypothetical protein GCM10010306_099770 [Streptomyces umbrinus]|nr:hypothetical protein GCM10010306_099770 [Streptomyces umbrinus]
MAVAADASASSQDLPQRGCLTVGESGQPFDAEAPGVAGRRTQKGTQVFGLKMVGEGQALDVGIDCFTVLRADADRERNLPSAEGAGHRRAAFLSGFAEDSAA